jgi:hypothetical protein
VFTKKRKTAITENSFRTCSQLELQKYLQFFFFTFTEQKNMHGVKKVILFCVMIVIIPASLIIMPLYLKHKIYHDVTYPVAESDVMEIRDGIISSIFCERHSLKMNSSFNAFQLNGEPQMSDKRKHIRLKKSMTLPDDTLEYWGFFLMKGKFLFLIDLHVII